MKRLLLLVCLPFLLTPAHADTAAVRKEIRKIRRAFLDVIELVPTPEEVDWYVVYNQNGYKMAVDYLIQHVHPEKVDSTREKLLNPDYPTPEEELLDKSVLEKNVIYLSGSWNSPFTPEVVESSKELLIRQALLASDDDPANTIDYLVNELTCRPATVEEANELLKIFTKVSLKADEIDAWKTVLAHIFELHDCRFK
ncbi:MAG: hypothetical protein WCL08_11090 [Verrucomicrobiota bacterium]